MHFILLSKSAYYKQPCLHAYFLPHICSFLYYFTDYGVGQRPSSVSNVYLDERLNIPVFGLLLDGYGWNKNIHILPPFGDMRAGYIVHYTCIYTLYAQTSGR
jgi:hypothetical protein